MIVPVSRDHLSHCDYLGSPDSSLDPRPSAQKVDLKTICAAIHTYETTAAILVPPILVSLDPFSI